MRFPEPGKNSVKTRGKWRSWAPAILSPCLFLLAAEGVLRLCGFGYPAGYLRPLAIGGKAYSIGNPDFFRTYFPARLAPYPDPVTIPLEKSPDAYRIFILGESAALGIPEPSFGFGRILERMLRDRYPGIRFEVINLSVTAIDSHVLLPIAEAASRRHPDLFILYMGNNEVIGPYGPGTVFAPFASGTALIRAAVAVKSTRTGQFLDGLLGRMGVNAAGRAKAAGGGGAMGRGNRAGAEKWAGMEMFLDRTVSRDDPRMQSVYANFRKNLDGILSAAKSSGARVIISTVAANLRDNAPFASVHRPGLSEPELKTWRGLCDSAAFLAAAGMPEAALRLYMKAEDIDSVPAEPRFRMGRSLLALGRAEEAAQAFQTALDRDALRFRADSRLNSILRESGRGRSSEGIWLADADSVFRSAAVDHAPGAEFFYEHVHLRFEGNYLLARTLVPYLDSALAVSGKADSRSSGPLLSAEACRASLALTGWNRLEMAKKILAMAERPPFSGKSDSGEHRARLKREVDSLGAYTGNDSLQAVLEEYQRAIPAAPGDLTLRRNLGDLFYACDYLPQAAENYRAVLEGVPQDTRTRQMLAKSLAEQGDGKGAVEEYGRALEFTPGAVELRNGLANSLAGMGDYAEAVRQYAIALQGNPDLAEVHFNLSRALTALGRTREAAEHLQASRRLDPDFAPATPENGL